jgi:hypothetical protein
MIKTPGTCLCKRRRTAFWCAAAVAMLSGWSVAFSQTTSLQQSFDLQVPWRPTAVVIGGQKLLRYELHLTNFASADLALKRIEIVDSAGVVLSDLKDVELKELIQRFDHSVGAPDKLLIPPGVHAGNSRRLLTL